MTLSLRHGATTCHGLSVFDACKDIPGYMGRDDALHFALVLGLQRESGLAGDVLEIGTWFGKSAAFIANFVRPGEKLILCDAFQIETKDRYSERPTVKALKANLRRGAPAFDHAGLELHACLSTGLRLAPGVRLRFAHVDGGHAREEALHDLRLIADFVVPGGVVVVDDYRHPQWPGVTLAVEDFLLEDRRFGEAAALNRWEAKGQKTYLVRRPGGAAD